MKRLAPIWIPLLVTCIAFAIVGRLKLSPDVADLLPDHGEGAALRDYVRVFGQGDLAMFLVRGPEPQQVRSASSDAAAALRSSDHVRAVVEEVAVDLPEDPSLAWAMADPRARQALADALTPEGMRRRLLDSKRLLLAPGSAQLAPRLARDPLRLLQVPFEDDVRLAGARTSARSLETPFGGGFVADEGRTRLLLLSVKGYSLRSAEAGGFVDAAQSSLAPVRASHPSVRFDLTGAHAIAAETERAMRSDLMASGILSAILAALAFALTFRRLRALLAVFPPLALGTLWTAAFAGLAFVQVSALTLGFLAVVVGVGLDTGIHVYGALLDARRHGMSPADAASFARRDTARPTLLAASIAAIAFGTLALSQVPAIRQFGVLCAVGELLTALAILAITPTLGAWLEHGTPPPARLPRWVPWIDRARRNQAAPILLGISVFVPLAVLVALGPPRLANRIVAIHPGELPSLHTNEGIVDRFGGGQGQWTVLLHDNDLDRVRRRADVIFEALADAPNDVAALDGLTRFAPTQSTQEARLRARDALGLPTLANQLRVSLRETGFEPSAFDAAISTFESPAHDVRDPINDDSDTNRLLRARYLALDAGTAWAAVYVRPREGRELEVASLVAGVDKDARLTGYARLESTLAEAVRTDLPRITWAAGLLVITAMLLALRSGRNVAIAAGALAFELLWLAALVRWAPLPVHIYNVFVIPVLLGITVDEAMFLLHRARGGSMLDALRSEGRNVVATAVTTAAGFAALWVCSFRGLSDMGTLGVLGVALGLFAALWVVPVAAGHRN